MHARGWEGREMCMCEGGKGEMWMCEGGRVMCMCEGGEGERCACVRVERERDVHV